MSIPTPTHLYPFTIDLNDTKGTADLSSTGSPTITHSQTEGMVLNKQGSASKYVSIPLGDIGMDSGKSWSLSWWYKIGSGVAWDGNGQDVVILGTRDHGVDYGLQLVSKYSLNANGIYCVYGFYGNDVFFYTGWPAVYTNVTNNQWVHFVIVYDKDNELGDGTHRKKMYVDGVELTNTSGVHNEWLGNNTTHKLDIGGRGWGSALNGNQHWLNLAIFDKALSLAEAQAIYAKDKYYGYGYEPTPISSISGSGVSCGTTSERDNLTYVEEGDVFYNTETSELQIYKNSVWRSLSHKIANDRNAFKITSGDSVPTVDSNSKEGNIFYNTNTGKLRIREESAWQVTSKRRIKSRDEFKILHGTNTPSVNTLQRVFYNTNTKKLQYLKNDSWSSLAEKEVAGDTFNVGVDSYKFSLNNAVQPELNLYRGNEYVFNQSSADNSGQRLYVSNDLSGRVVSGGTLLAGGWAGQSNGTASSSSHNDSRVPQNAFNDTGGYNDMWQPSNSPGQYLTFTFNSEVKITRYFIVKTFSNKNVESWKLHGRTINHINNGSYNKNDSSTYDEIDVVSGHDYDYWNPSGSTYSGNGAANSSSIFPLATNIYDANANDEGLSNLPYGLALEFIVNTPGLYKEYIILLGDLAGAGTSDPPLPSDDVRITEVLYFADSDPVTSENTTGFSSTGTLGTDLVSTWTIPTDASDTMYYASDGSANAGGKINITNVPAQEKTFVVDVSLVQSQSGGTVIGLAGAGGLYTVGGSEYSSNPATIQINSGSHIFDGYYYTTSGWSPSNSSSERAHRIWTGAMENIINNTIDSAGNTILSNAPDEGTIDQNTVEFSVIITFPVSVVINEYKMWARDSGDSLPKEWTLRATDNLAGYQQNNVLTYTQLDDRDSITGWVDPGSGTPNVNNANSYTFANTSAYKTYIINFTESNRTTHIALNELAYYGYVPSLDNAFTLGGVAQPTLNLYRDSVYKFDQSDPDNVGQRLFVSNDLSGGQRGVVGNKLPDVAMTSNDTTDCEASVSSQYSDWSAFKAFNHVIGDEGWHSAIHVYNATTGYANTGEADSSFQGYYGQWIKIRFKTKSFFLKELKVYPRAGYYGDSNLRAPDDGYVFGSLDGTTWTELLYFTAITNSGNYQSNVGKIINVSATTAFSYYVLLTTKLSGGVGEHNVNISEIELYPWDGGMSINTNGVTSAGTLGTDLVTTWRVPTDASDTMYYASDGSANMGGTISITDAPTKKSRVRTLVSAGSNGGGDTYTKYAVDVSLNRFTIGGHLQPTLNLYKDSIYRFDQSDPDNVGQRLFVSNDLSGGQRGLVDSIILYEIPSNLTTTNYFNGSSTNVVLGSDVTFDWSKDWEIKTSFTINQSGPNHIYPKIFSFVSNLNHGASYTHSEFDLLFDNNGKRIGLVIQDPQPFSSGAAVWVSGQNNGTLVNDELLLNTRYNVLVKYVYSTGVITAGYQLHSNFTSWDDVIIQGTKFVDTSQTGDGGWGSPITFTGSITYQTQNSRIGDRSTNDRKFNGTIHSLTMTNSTTTTTLTENTAGVTSAGTLGTDLITTWRVPTDASDTMYYASDGSANAGGKINVEVTPYEEKTYAVDVSLNAFTLGGLVQPTLNLYRDSVYNFDQSDPDNVGQRLYVSNEAVIGGTNASTQFPKVNLTSATSVDCVVTASSSPYNGDPKWRAFDGNTGTFWQCQQNTYTNGVANTGANNSSFQGIYGEWIQIHFQVESFILKELKVGARGGHGGPDEGYVFGSLDGSSWTQLTNFTGITNSGAYEYNGYKTIDISAPKAYSYYVLLTTLISANSTELNITEIQLHSWDPQRTILVENTNGVTSTGTLGTDLVTRWRVPTDASSRMYYASDGSANAGGKINITDIPTQTGTTTECLSVESVVNVVTSGGNKYRLNNDTTYDSTKIYGLGSRTYTFKSVPSLHPIAILNAGKTMDISYSGVIANESNMSVTGTENDGTYKFYHGDVNVDVLGDFGSVSIYCLHHGYMGGKNLLRYSELCGPPFNVDINGTKISSYDDYTVHEFKYDPNNSTSGETIYTITIKETITADFLLIAGGGGGGKPGVMAWEAGGGGAGELIYQTNIVFQVGTYIFKVGDGGEQRVTLSNTEGPMGYNSSIIGNGLDNSYNSLISGYIAKGGQSGSIQGQISYNTYTPKGGSGGGNSFQDRTYRSTPVSGTITVYSDYEAFNPSTTADEVGYFGNKGGVQDSGSNSAGGGGGAGGAGGGNSGGNSKSYSIRDGSTQVPYAGGGGGSGNGGGIGGDGGGNAGQDSSNRPGGAADSHTGSGGGGGYQDGDGGKGGSGLIIIRYKI